MGDKGHTQLKIDQQKSAKLAHKLRAHFAKNAHKLATTRRAIEGNIILCIKLMEPGAARNP
eukprot:1153379-Pelagomonas_calceolata.AAC.4